MLAMTDVCEKLVGEPKAGDLLSDLRAFTFDQGDPLPPVADAELSDLSER